MMPLEFSCKCTWRGSSLVNLMSSVCSHDFVIFGKHLHSSLVTSDLDPDVVVETALISMYITFINLANAQSLFNHMPT